MSGELNVTDPDKPKKILMVIANPATSTTLGIPVGFWGAELTHAWFAFNEAGYEVTVASPDGGKTMTGFANGEEQFADEYVGTQVMPWHIEDAARERGANYIQAGRFKPFAVRDGRLITGQQQYSGGEVARLVIEALGT